MPDKKSNQGKHLTGEDRQYIMECLDKGMAFKAIAKRIGKAATTVSREVKKHFEVRASNQQDSEGSVQPQAAKPCPVLLKAPFVCNPCKKRRYHCGYQKQVYVAKKAQIEYETLLRESREGIPLQHDEFWQADAIITQGMKKGQHLYHIMATNRIGFSKSSAYRHLHRGYLSVCKLDFPRVVKFKARKERRPDSVPKALKAGRTYADFRSLIEDRRISSWVKMDTVIGRIGGKAIMTFNFTFCNFHVWAALGEQNRCSSRRKNSSSKDDNAGKKCSLRGYHSVAVNR